MNIQMKILNQETNKIQLKNKYQIKKLIIIKKPLNKLGQEKSKN